MHLSKTLILNYTQSLDLFNVLLSSGYSNEYDFKKNHVDVFNNNGQSMLHFRFPLALNLYENIIKDKKLFNSYTEQPLKFFVMLIQTGNAALGFFNQEYPLHHKVIRKYMVRQKQGKSQLNFLKKKGKSRAGSRIRLSNAVSFFEEINTKMNEWITEGQDYPLLYSCTPLLWGMLFNSKVSFPIGKKDKRLKKIPLDIRKPDFQVLQDVARHCLKGFLDININCNRVVLENIGKIINLPSN